MRRLYSISLLLVIFMGIFSGCSKIQYEAEMLNDNASEIINQSFYEQNFTYGAYYNSNTSLQDPSFPSSRTFVIKTQEECDDIIVFNANLNVDFASEIIIVYTYTSDYVRDIKIDDIQVFEQNLNIELSLSKASNGVGDAVQPFQRYVVLKMKKIDFATVDVVLE